MPNNAENGNWPLAFSVSHEPAGGALTSTAVVSCSGELDMATGPKLREALESVQDVDVIADLTGLSFIDSTGISILLGTMRKLEAADRRLVVVCPPGAPRRVFELTGLQEILLICDTREDAESRMSSGPGA